MCCASVYAPLREWYVSLKRVSCRVELPSPLVVMLCSIFVPGVPDCACLQCKIRYNCLELLYLRVIGAVCVCFSHMPAKSEDYKIDDKIKIWDFQIC